MNTLNNGSIKKVCSISFNLAGIIVYFLISQSAIASDIEVYEKNNSIYYTPFSKICTSSEVQQFIKQSFGGELIQDDSPDNVKVGKVMINDAPHPSDVIKEKEYELRIISCGKFSVPEVTNLLQSDDRQKINTALSILKEIGPDAAGATHSLIDFLKKSDGDARDYCIKTIAAIGPSAKDAVSELILLLKNKKTAKDAAFALGEIGTAAKAAIPELIKSKEFFSVKALEKICDDETLVTLANNQSIVDMIDQKIMLNAARRLVKNGNNANIIPALIHVTRGWNKNIAAVAVKILGSMKEKSLPAVPTLIEVLKKTSDRNYSALGSSIEYALSDIGPSVVPYLIPLLSDSTNKKVRAHAVLALSEIGPDAQAAIPHLRQLLKKGKKSQLLAAIALAELGVNDKSIRDILIQWTEIEDYEVQKEVNHAIWRIDNEKKHVIGIKQPEPSRIRIGIADPDEIDEKKDIDNTSVILTSLQSENDYVRINTIHSFVTMKKPPVDAAKQIEEIFNKSKNQDERRIAAFALDIIGHDVSWFFKDNRLVAPTSASCPLHYDGEYHSSFDFYTGKCKVVFYNRSQSMQASVMISGLVDFFSDDKDSDSAVQEANDAVKQK